MNTRVDPFQVAIDPETREHVVTGPNEYRYVLRGAQSAKHAETWAIRLNAAYEMGFNAGRFEEYGEEIPRPILVL